MVHARGKDAHGLAVKRMKQLFFEGLATLGERKRVLLLPPDITRLHGMGGTLAVWAVEYYRDAVKAILPALGTHVPMTADELDIMFPGVDHRLFVGHDWRNDVVTLGTVPASFVEQVSEGRLSYSWDAQVNRLLVEGSFDLILSLGQVVPHEVIGMRTIRRTSSSEPEERRVSTRATISGPCMAWNGSWAGPILLSGQSSITRSPTSHRICRSSSH